jgi:hypothetical protein
MSKYRRLNAEEQAEMDKAIEGVKTSETKLEFAPGWDEQSLTDEEQEELAEIEEAFENGTPVSVMTPESKAEVQEAAAKWLSKTPKAAPSSREGELEIIEDAMMRVAMGVQKGKYLPHDVHDEAVDLAKWHEAAVAQQVEAAVREARTEFLEEQIADIDEAIVLWRKNERKHHTWLLAWLQDDKAALARFKAAQPQKDNQ